MRLPPVSREASGLLLSVASTLFGTVMSICAKVLGERGVGVFVIIAGSRVVLLAATLCTLAVQRLNPLRSKRKLLLLLRGAMGFCVITTIFYSVQLLPLSDATVLSRLSPLIIALLAPRLLGEPHSRGVWAALPVCLAGVVVMAWPRFLFGGIGAGGGKPITAKGLAVGLSQAVAQALTRIVVRALGAADEPTANIIISGAVVTASGGALLAALVPGQLDTAPGGFGCGLLGVMGLMACGVQVTSTVALKRVRVAPAAALNYLSVVWALLADYLVFGHAPAPLSLLGAGLICCSTFALLLWEARAKAAGGSGRPLKPSRSGAVEAGPDAAAEEQRLLQPQEPEGGPPGPGPEQELAELGWAAGGSAARRRHLLPQHGGVGQGREGSGELTESEEDGTAGRQHLQGPQRTQEKEGVVEAQVGGGGVTAEGERRPQIVRS